ncbi:MAG: fibronectin type 3 domain-containing protein [Crocinitomix sp.]|jgi:fibronectin type 3 domain-containing protein
MKKQLILFVLCFCVSFSFSQDREIYLQSFVKSDTIQLRWAASSPDLFIRGLNEGYSISRTNTATDEKFEFEILPFSDRKKTLLTSTDTITAFTASFIEEYISHSAVNEDQKQAPYFMLNLSASTNRAIANVLGVYWEDLNAGKNTFTYTIQFAGSADIADKVEVNTKQKSKNEACSKLIGTSRIDLKEVYLIWEAKTLNKAYGGYWLLKSEDGKNFKRLNSTPLYYLTSQYEPNKTIIDFIDTAVTEGETYYYKVTPINHFAELGEDSNIAEVFIQRRLNGICNIDTVRSTKRTRIIVGKYRTDIPEDKISAYVLLRGDNIDSPFKVIAKIKSNANNFEFTYQANLLSGDRHYFKVAAISADGDTALSFPYYHFSLDQEPPEKPTAFKGEINENGIANLSWSAPADNDIQGYRIFRANSLKEEFIEVTKRLSPELSYQDTLRLDNLTSEVYYKIRTVDLNFNNSKSTTPILVMKPDTIAPVPCVIKKYKVEPKGIYLEWVNSQSTDLAGQYLVRKGVSKVDTLLNFQTEFEQILDTTCQIGGKYEYQILTVDRSNNKSFSAPLSVTYETGYRAAPINFSGVVNREGKVITLAWGLNSVEPIYSIQIYRAKNEGKFKLHYTIREDVTTYEDLKLSPNNVYHYKVKVVYQSGKSSKMSGAVEIVY